MPSHNSISTFNEHHQAHEPTHCRRNHYTHPQYHNPPYHTPLIFFPHMAYQFPVYPGQSPLQFPYAQPYHFNQAKTTPVYLHLSTCLLSPQHSSHHYNHTDPEPQCARCSTPLENKTQTDSDKDDIQCEEARDSEKDGENQAVGAEGKEQERETGYSFVGYEEPGDKGNGEEKEKRIV